MNDWLDMLYAPLICNWAAGTCASHYLITL